MFKINLHFSVPYLIVAIAWLIFFFIKKDILSDADKKLLRDIIFGLRGPVFFGIIFGILGDLEGGYSYGESNVTSGLTISIIYYLIKISKTDYEAKQISKISKFIGRLFFSIFIFLYSFFVLIGLDTGEFTLSLSQVNRNLSIQKYQKIKESKLTLDHLKDTQYGQGRLEKINYIANNLGEYKTGESTSNTNKVEIIENVSFIYDDNFTINTDEDIKNTVEVEQGIEVVEIFSYKDFGLFSIGIDETDQEIRDGLKGFSEDFILAALKEGVSQSGTKVIEDKIEKLNGRDVYIIGIEFEDVTSKIYYLFEGDKVIIMNFVAKSYENIEEIDKDILSNILFS